MKALKDLFKVSSAAALRLPLHLALTTTPVILLIPISLTGIRDSKMDILSVRLYILNHPVPTYQFACQVMKDLGNIRPQALRDIESFVWSMVLKIARGEMQAADALEELMDHIPWNIVEAWGPEDPNRTWFRPGNSLLLTTWSTHSEMWFEYSFNERGRQEWQNTRGSVTEWDEF